MRRLTQGLGVVPLLAILGACIGDIGHTPLQHNCDTFYNQNWAIHNLVVEHTDTRVCPIYAHALGLMMSAATVYDRDADYATNDPGTASIGTIGAFNNYDTEYFVGLTQLGDDSDEFFSWGPAFPGSGETYSRQTQLFLNWTAFSSPDYLEFWVVGFDYSDAKGVVQLDYTNDAG